MKPGDVVECVKGDAFCLIAHGELYTIDDANGDWVLVKGLWWCASRFKPITQSSTAPAPRLPADSAERKLLPIATGVLDYFPLAIAEVARVSRAGNEQHNPGQPLHWDRSKSQDHADCAARHLIDRGTFDTDGMRHSAKLAWRALAALQLELEDAARKK